MPSDNQPGALQGYPVNIKDFKVLLDKRVYHNLEGQWRDLFNRLKWDTVKSALKSVAGLQGRKFKVRPQLCWKFYMRGGPHVKDKRLMSPDQKC